MGGLFLFGDGGGPGRQVPVLVPGEQVVTGIARRSAGDWAGEFAVIRMVVKIESWAKINAEGFSDRAVGWKA